MQAGQAAIADAKCVGRDSLTMCPCLKHEWELGPYNETRPWNVGSFSSSTRVMKTCSSVFKNSQCLQPVLSYGQVGLSLRVLTLFSATKALDLGMIRHFWDDFGTFGDKNRTRTVNTSLRRTNLYTTFDKLSIVRYPEQFISFFSFTSGEIRWSSTPTKKWKNSSLQ